jgi:anti-sigma B factor antagonist
MPVRNPEQLQIIATQEPTGERRVVVAGELDLAVADELAAASRAHLDGTGQLELDLTGVTFMDSTGVGLLVSLADEAREDGWRLTVVAGDAAWRVIELCALQELRSVRRA